ncbi:MAG TPA: hypothetical protein VNW47_17305 [Terriglobales bacterium]|nr:hypothetical protein [Terriglobales bacterium]
MTGATWSLDVGMLLLGAIGLFAGLSRLGTSPLAGVLIILSAMFFLLFPVAGLCKAEVQQKLRRRK